MNTVNVYMLLFEQNVHPVHVIVCCMQAVCTVLMLFHSRDNDDLFHFVH